MISVSNKWKEYAKSNASFAPGGTLWYVGEHQLDEDSIDLTAEDFMEGSVRFTDSISDTDKLTLGSVITNTCNFTLNNSTGKFNAIKDWLYIELTFTAYFSDGTSETIDRGVYNLDTPSVLGATIECEGYDNMDLLNKRFINKVGRSWGLSPTVHTITYPISVEDLFEGLVEYCSTVERPIVGFYDVPHTSSQVSSVYPFEYNESTTCRDVIGWLAERVGAYVRADGSGYLRMKPLRSVGWDYTTTFYGGTISPWNETFEGDGGTISPWSDPELDMYGGLIAGNAFDVNGIKTSSVTYTELKVGKVEAYAYNTVDEPIVGSWGSLGYIIRIKDNPMIISDSQYPEVSPVFNAHSAWMGMGDANGFQFAPFNMTIFGDPSIEAGDNIIVTDYLGDKHFSIITDLTYSIGDMQLSCDAKPEEENNLYYGNEQTDTVARAVSAAKKVIEEETPGEIQTAIDDAFEEKTPDIVNEAVTEAVSQSTTNLNNAKPGIITDAYNYVYNNLADVVIEQSNGASSGYRKWKNGGLEYWCKVTKTVNVDTSIGDPVKGYYKAVDLSDITYPVSFAHNPIVTVSMYCATRGYWHDLGTEGTLNHPPNVRVYSFISHEYNFEFYIHALGSWK